MKRTLQFAAASIAILLAADTAFAQGCAQCLTYASAAGKRAQAWLDFGIAVLLIPTLLIFAGIFLLFVRRARAADSAAELDSSAPLAPQPAPAPVAIAIAPNLITH
jgi:heme/copper-type cytochrome/quinol oxidase subunit 2